ncbi:hypothetical protein niasHT_001574 [Heterodera trifolii]|uniref:Uncharacterized protein n=1 Tax=Heterodera trifolii TaxID=157864 RepID=A0ABD2MCG8_9BILA
MCSSPLLFSSFLLFLPLTSAFYFVLTRYSPLQSASSLGSGDRFLASISPKEVNPSDREWTVGMSTLGEEGPIGGAENWAKKRGGGKGATGKRTAGNAIGLPSHENVCTTVIRSDHRPQFGREQNGTLVEIQQDENRQFSATFVECSNTKKGNCHGIDNAIFSSECVTLYEFRPAGVRVEGNSAEFVEGFVRVPITCQCQLRRKKKHGIYSN